MTEPDSTNVSPSAVADSAPQDIISRYLHRYQAKHHLRKSPEEYAIEDHGFGTPCWVWLLSKNGAGYGEIRVGNTKCYAHRLYYERVYGPIASGLELDHRCHNPSCVNPDHLEPITHAENIQRGKSTKLTVEKVLEVRRLAKVGLSYKQIGLRIGTSKSNVKAIVTRASWKNV